MFQDNETKKVKPFILDVVKIILFAFKSSIISFFPDDPKDGESY